MFKTNQPVKDYLGFPDEESSDSVKSDVNFDGQMNPRHSNSNIALLNFDRKILADTRDKPRYGEWDFLTLYKTLMFVYYKNKIPKNINNRNLKNDGLEIRQTQNYKKEMIEMKKYFIKRYNLIKSILSKIESLEFIKNGAYINALKQLKKIQKKLENKVYMDEIKYLMSQSVLNKEEKEQLTNYTILVKKEEHYKQVVIGGNYEQMRFDKQEQEETEKMYEKIKRINKEYKSNNIKDAKYHIKQILIKQEKFKSLKNEDLYLRSKMIKHLMNFLNIDTPKAVTLLEKNLFNSLIKLNMNDIKEKKNEIEKELISYEPIKNYLNKLEDKTFVCPYCTYTHNLQINVLLHITTFHSEKRNNSGIRNPGFEVNKYKKEEKKTEKKKEEKKEVVIKEIMTNIFNKATKPKKYEVDEKNPNEIKNKVFDKDLYQHPIMIVEPVRDSVGNFVSIYDEYKAETKNQVIDHIKRLNIITKDKTEPLPKRVIKIMVPYDITFGNINIIKDKTEVKRNKRGIKVIELPIDEKMNEKKIREHIENLELVKFFKKKEYIEDYKEIQSEINKTIKKASKIRNISLAMKWVETKIVKKYMKKTIGKINRAKIIITYGEQKHETKFEKLENIIINEMPTYVEINGKVLIDEGKYIDKPNVEFTKETLINNIKTEIFLQKVRKFTKRFVRQYLKNRRGNTEYKNNIITKDIIELFKKIINQQGRKLLLDNYKNVIQNKEHESKYFEDTYINYADNFDVLIQKLNNLNSKNIGDYLLKNITINSKDKIGDVDEMLYFLLLSFLKNDNPAVLHTYKVLEGENEDETINKSNVWEWKRKYINRKEEDAKKFKKINTEASIKALFPDSKENTLEREITNYRIGGQYIYKLSDLKGSQYNKRDDMIYNFIKKSFEKGLVDKDSYKLYLATLFLNKLVKLIKKEPNADKLKLQFIYRYLKILDLYIEKPKIFERVKVVNNKLQNVKDKKPIQENKTDDLLNDFMDLNEDEMRIKLDTDRQNEEILDDEASVFEVEMEEGYDIVDEVEDSDDDLF